MGKFDNQVVIITGTSSGIGRTTAKKFAAEGAKVVGVARRAELQNSLEDEITSTGGEFTGIVGEPSLSRRSWRKPGRQGH